jgi:SRSO17 transposase
MAARVAPHDVRQTHQSLHHLVAQASWSDEALLQQVRQSVLPQMEQDGPVIAWIVDDTGFLKKGTHSVGVACQYCGQIGKQDNCQIAVSLSIMTEHASLPIAWRLYLPETWAEDEERREAAGVPKEISFQSKWAIALEQIRKAVRDGIPAAPALADAAYGDNYGFREGITELGLRYVVGVRERTT